MTSMLHDTHFHLDLFNNPGNVLAQIERAKIYTIAVTNLPDLFSHTDTLTQNSKYVRPALGFHPELVCQHKQQFEKFIKLCEQTRYIGEVGLDNYNKSPSDYATQKNVFEKIIRNCSDLGKKILTVHSRRAEKDVVSIVGSNFSGKIILHWYSGSIKEIERALDYNFYFSVNYAMTQSDSGKKIIDCIPVEKLLLETDGPFIDIRGKKSTPETTAIILQNIAIIKKNPNMGLMVKENFVRLLS